MSLEIWIAFVAASSVLLMVPGPTVILVVSYALGYGRSSGWATVPGVALGDFTAMTVSLLGAGAILAASATLFMVLKLIGAAYLIWIGIQLWRSKPELSGVLQMNGSASLWSMFVNAFTVTALNPKGIVFFVAFVPQFVDPSAPALPQFALLLVTFVALAAINVTVWALLAGQFQASFKNPDTLRTTNRIGASFLIGAGVLTAAYRRTT
jgi:threonine/homoserine/homoserine lactone efflux protein